MHACVRTFVRLSRYDDSRRHRYLKQCSDPFEVTPFRALPDFDMMIVQSASHFRHLSPQSLTPFICMRAFVHPLDRGCIHSCICVFIIHSFVYSTRRDEFQSAAF